MRIRYWSSDVCSSDLHSGTGQAVPSARHAGGRRQRYRQSLQGAGVRARRSQGGHTADRMIALVEGSNRQKTPNEIALGIVLLVLTATFLIVVVTLPFIGDRKS